MNVSLALRPLAAALVFAGVAGLTGIAAPAGAQTPMIEGILVEPTNPTVRDDVELVVVGRQSPDCPFVLGQPTYNPITFLYHIQASDPECGAPATEPFETRFSLGKLPADVYRVEIRRGLRVVTSQEMFYVAALDPSASLREGHFLISVEWRNPRDGTKGTGYVTALTDESTAFWFFDPSNVEITLKVLDGRPLNDHWWVFIASMTDLEVKVTVLENKDDCLLLPVFPPACPTRVYQQTAGRNRNFIDVQAFAD